MVVLEVDFPRRKRKVESNGGLKEDGKRLEKKPRKQYNKMPKTEPAKNRLTDSGWDFSEKTDHEDKRFEKKPKKQHIIKEERKTRTEKRLERKQKKQYNIEPKTDTIKNRLMDPGWDFSETIDHTDKLLKVAKLIEDQKLNNDELSTEITIGQEPSKSVIDKENETIALESRIIEGMGPESEAEFGIMLKRNPNSAQLWIRYMGYVLGKKDLVSARNTAQRALKVIDYREDSERLAMWTAYLNMEISFGEGDLWKSVFQEACGNADSFKIHKQTAAILAKNGKNTEADEIYLSMIKRFRKVYDEVWILYANFLMTEKRFEEARDLLKKALASVQKAGHTHLISRFATLEFEKGDTERGRTLFESILSNFPKKVDIWSVYLNLILKHDSQENIRALFDRICSLPLSSHKLRPFYKKWAEYEEKHGDERSQNEVRNRAVKLLRTV